MPIPTQHNKQNFITTPGLKDTHGPPLEQKAETPQYSLHKTALINPFLMGVCIHVTVRQWALTPGFHIYEYRWCRFPMSGAHSISTPDSDNIVPKLVNALDHERVGWAPNHVIAVTANDQEPAYQTSVLRI